VLIYDPDRLARGKPWLRPFLEEQLARPGAPVTYLTYTVEDTPEGRVMDGMRSLFAEWEREKFAARTKDGRERRIRAGHIWRPMPAFGFAYSKPEPGQQLGTLAPVPEEAAIVRLVLDHILAGCSLRWVAAELIRLGVRTCKGGVWDHKRVFDLVTNPIYAGTATFNRFAAVEPAHPRGPYRSRKWTTRIERPREEWIVTPVPAVVTPEEQGRAIALLARNKALAKRNTRREYLLAPALLQRAPHRDGRPLRLAAMRLLRPALPLDAAAAVPLHSGIRGA
jgi:site-specific DNA recombinase